MNARLPAISVIDVRDGGPLRHARERAAEARALRDACLAFFPRAMLPALPLLDRAARRWLTRSRSPYVEEVGEVADTLGFPGVWLLNASYQWACTALAREEGGAPWLVRTLDWPFQGLGRYAEVARMQRSWGRIFQRHLAGLCRRADRDGAVPLRCLDQPGADAPAHGASLAAAW